MILLLLLVCLILVATLEISNAQCGKTWYSKVLTKDSVYKAECKHMVVLNFSTAKYFFDIEKERDSLNLLVGIYDNKFRELRKIIPNYKAQRDSIEVELKRTITDYENITNVNSERLKNMKVFNDEIRDKLIYTNKKYNNLAKKNLRLKKISLILGGTTAVQALLLTLILL